MILKPTNQIVKEYEQNTAINQSSLKLLLQNPIFFKQLQEEVYEEKEHFLIGSGVDTKLTLKEGEFDKLFHLMSGNKPSDNVVKFMNLVFNSLDPEEEINEDFTWYAKEFWEVFNKEGYYLNRAKSQIEQDNRLNELTKDSNAHSYWKTLIQSTNKKILSLDQMSIINTIVSNIVDKDYPNNPYENERMRPNEIVLLFQLPIYFKMEEIDCKGLIDLIEIDIAHKTMTIYDIKTTYDYTFNFKQAVKKRRYDFQIAFYYIGLIQNFEKLSNIVKRRIPDFDMSYYRLQKPRFLVESTKFSGYPMVYICEDNLLNVGINGLEEVRSSDNQLLKAETKGIEQALALYKYYQTYGFNMEKSMRESRGNYTLNWD